MPYRYLAGGEYERTRRQRDVLTYIFQEAKSCSLTELNGLLQTLLPELTTNESPRARCSPWCWMRLLSWAMSWNPGVFLWKGPTRICGLDGKAVIGIDFDANRDALYDIIYGER